LKADALRLNCSEDAEIVYGAKLRDPELLNPRGALVVGPSVNQICRRLV